MPKLWVIDDETVIKELLNNISKYNKMPVSAIFENIKETVMLKFSKSESLPYSACKKIVSLANIGDKIDVSFYYNEKYFNFETKIAKIEGECCYILVPEKISSTIKRMKPRYIIKNEENIVISFNDLENKYKVIDISTHGLSFEANKKLFVEGQTITDIILQLNGQSNIRVNGLVRNVISAKDGNYRFGIEFLDIKWLSHMKLFRFIFEKSHSDLKRSTWEKHLSRL